VVRYKCEKDTIFYWWKTSCFLCNIKHTLCF